MPTRLYGRGKVLHRESRTFAHRSAALSWAKHCEVALEDPAELTRLRQTPITLAELIRWYSNTFETTSCGQRSKQTHLKFLGRHALGKTIAHKLTATDLIRHVQSRRACGPGQATVINDLVWIGVALWAAQSVGELAVSPEIVVQARTGRGELRLIGKAKRRTRQSTADELARLREHFRKRDRRAEIPMEITELVLDAFEQALHARWTSEGLIHHSDHSVQYLSIRYR